MDDEPEFGLTRRDALPARAHRVELHTALALIALFVEDGPGSEAVLLPPVDPPLQLTFDQPPRFGLLVRASEDLRAVAHREVEVEVRFARRAKHETLTHEFHAIHATAQAAVA